MKGFLRGSYQAFSGIVVKPITGILDAASKTAEGIRYSSNLNNEVELTQRIRLPRVFYGRERFLKNYLPLDAEVFALLQQNDEKGEYASLSYIDTIQINQENEKDALWLIVTVEKLLFVSGSSQKFVLSTDMNNIKHVKSYKDFILFQFHKPTPRDSSNGSIIEDADITSLSKIRHKDEQLIVANHSQNINHYVEKLIINVLNYYKIDSE